jgi:excisionase family DNA binding protein
MAVNFTVGVYRVPKSTAAPKKVSSRSDNIMLYADGFMNVREGAAFLRIGESTLRKMLAKGAIAYVRVGADKRIPKKALFDYLEQHIVRAESKSA